MVESAPGDDGSGLKAGIRSAVSEAGPLLPLRDEEQLSLLAEDAGSLGVTSTHVARAGRGRGRPRGAGNKRNADVRAYLLSRYAHPLETLAQFQSRPVDALAAELGCSKREAAQMQIRAAAELAPYIEGKMPVSIDLSATGDFNLLIPGLNISEGDARLAAEGDFVIDGNAIEYLPVEDDDRG